MRRLLLATAVAAVAASSFATSPASAAGYCDQKIEVGCNMSNCSPDFPCTPVICVLYVAPRCVL